MIPEELYQAVAQLLAYVYRVAGARGVPPHELVPEEAARHADLLAAGAVVLVVAMMIIPLPPFLLDLVITLNISAALMIVVATLYVPRALDFSSFPCLLLLTTLFRLAINVSVTRLILLHGDAGHVVTAFGNFVVGGNVVVGLVIFLILIVIQFVVITNGAGRVAEVGARFTLDAMPGKQMAIDADLNTGQITDEEARKRRAEIAQEADFYGAMDGASKFVKGDAMAGILITLINLHRRHRRSASCSRACRSARPRTDVLAADRRRRPVRADPGAADLRRDRHPRHALGLREGPRHRHRAASSSTSARRRSSPAP